MPVTFPMMRRLNDAEQKFRRRSMLCAPRNGEIPVGGGEWMDNFFKAEALAGVLASLRRGETLAMARSAGAERCKAAIDKWNASREWQVRRSDCWVESFILENVRAAVN